MKNAIVFAAVLACSLTATDCAAQGTSSRFTLSSKAVGTTYTIDVVMPQGGASAGKRLPVAYCTDWFVLADYLRSLPKLMDMGRLTEPFMMVGISEGGTQRDWAMARNRDFTPARPTDAYSKEKIYAPALEKAGGAARFVTFLKDELIPLVEAKFPADPARRAFVSYSLGGLLGTHLLHKEPYVFQYYLLGSPSLWFNEFGLAAEFGGVPADDLRSIKKVCRCRHSRATPSGALGARCLDLEERAAGPESHKAGSVHSKHGTTPVVGGAHGIGTRRQGLNAGYRLGSPSASSTRFDDAGKGNTPRSPVWSVRGRSRPCI